MSEIKPITPKEVVHQKSEGIPDFVLKVFNDLIAAMWNGDRSEVAQGDVILEIVRNSELSRGEILSKGYLEIEEIYRAAGWEVEYDKPGYNESYPARFIFRKRTP